MQGREANLIRSIAFRAIEETVSDRFRIVNISFDGTSAVADPPIVATREAVRCSDLVIVILWQDKSYFDDRTMQTAIGHEVNEAKKSGKPILAYFEEEFDQTINKVLLKPSELSEDLHGLNRVGASLRDFIHGVMISPFKMADVLDNSTLLKGKIKSDLERHLSRPTRFSELRSKRNRHSFLSCQIAEAGDLGHLGQRIRSLKNLIQDSKCHNDAIESYDPTNLYIELAGLHIAAGNINEASKVLGAVESSLSTELQNCLWLALNGQCRIYSADFLKGAEFTRMSLDISEGISLSIANGERRGIGVADEFVFLAEQGKLNPYLNSALLGFYAGDYCAADEWIEKCKSIDQCAFDSEGVSQLTVLQGFILMEFLWKTPDDEHTRLRAEGILEIIDESPKDMHLASQRLSLAGELSLFRRDDNAADTKFLQALELAQRVEDFGLMGHLYWKKGVLSAFRNEEEMAGKQFKKAIDLHMTYGFLAEIPKIRADWRVIQQAKNWENVAGI